MSERKKENVSDMKQLTDEEMKVATGGTGEYSPESDDGTSPTESLTRSESSGAFDGSGGTHHGTLRIL